MTLIKKTVAKFQIYLIEFSKLFLTDHLDHCQEDLSSCLGIHVSIVDLLECYSDHHRYPNSG